MEFFRKLLDRNEVMSIIKKLQVIITFLVCSGEGILPSGCSVPGLLRPGEDDDGSVARNLVASFIMFLAGSTVPGSDLAARYLQEARLPAAEFLREGIGFIVQEVEERYNGDGEFRRSFDLLYGYVVSPEARPGSPEAAGRTAAVFFPEGLIEGGVTAAVERLRERRSVNITSLNPVPIDSPGRQVLFASNILLTVPRQETIDAMDCSAEMKRALACAAEEEQAYWYDHPVPVGAAPEENEALYGLGNLAEALAFEESAGNKEPGRNIDLVCLTVGHAPRPAERGQGMARVRAGPGRRAPGDQPAPFHGGR